MKGLSKKEYVMEMQKPYIGVTGFMSREEVEDVLSFLPENLKRLLMVGVLVSSKTLAGHPNRWPNRYPSVSQISQIFVNDPRTLNLVHYHPDDSSALVDQLEQVVKLAGPNLNGLQLNACWPSPEQVAAFRGGHPEMFLVLQVGGRAMGVVGGPGPGLVNQVEKYAGLADAVLIDPSGGNGMPMDVLGTARCLETVRLQCPGVMLAVAGGLGPSTLDILDSFIPYFPDLSIDAEGKLRTPQPEDRLDPARVREYLLRAYMKF